MAFRLMRMVRGGRLFPNGTFLRFEEALKAKLHGEQWHQANGTSAKFLIQDDKGQNVPDDFEDEDEFVERPQLPEENAEERIKQLEQELAATKRKLLAVQEEEDS